MIQIQISIQLEIKKLWKDSNKFRNIFIILPKDDK